MTKYLDKKTLYNSVKSLIEIEENHIHLNQQKLYTLFSIGFQYMLYQSTQNHGNYLIRIKDSMIAEQLVKKAKDETSQKFLRALLLPRKLKYKKSTFYLDFFNPKSWGLIQQFQPTYNFQGALIVKDTQSENFTLDTSNEEEESALLPQSDEEKKAYYYGLQENSKTTLIIGFNESYNNTKVVSFPFIEENKEKAFPGVQINCNLNNI